MRAIGCVIDVLNAQVVRGAIPPIGAEAAFLVTLAGAAIAVGRGGFEAAVIDADIPRIAIAALGHTAATIVEAAALTGRAGCRGAAGCVVANLGAGADRVAGAGRLVAGEAVAGIAGGGALDGAAATVVDGATAAITGVQGAALLLVADLGVGAGVIAGAAIIDRVELNAGIAAAAVTGVGAAGTAAAHRVAAALHTVAAMTGGAVAAVADVAADRPVEGADLVRTADRAGHAAVAAEFTTRVFPAAVVAIAAAAAVRRAAGRHRAGALNAACGRAAIAVGGAGPTDLDAAEARDTGATVADFIGCTAGDIDATAAEPAGIAAAGADRIGLGAGFGSLSLGRCPGIRGFRFGGSARVGGIGPGLCRLSLGGGAGVIGSRTGGQALIAGRTGGKAFAAGSATRRGTAAFAAQPYDAGADQTGKSPQNSTARGPTGEAPCESIKSRIVHSLPPWLRELNDLRG